MKNACGKASVILLSALLSGTTFAGSPAQPGEASDESEIQIRQPGDQTDTQAQQSAQQQGVGTQQAQQQGVGTQQAQQQGVGTQQAQQQEEGTQQAQDVSEQRGQAGQLETLGGTTSGGSILSPQGSEADVAQRSDSLALQAIHMLNQAIVKASEIAISKDISDEITDSAYEMEAKYSGNDTQVHVLARRSDIDLSKVLSELNQWKVQVDNSLRSINAASEDNFETVYTEEMNELKSALLKALDTYKSEGFSSTVVTRFVDNTYSLIQEEMGAMSDVPATEQPVTNVPATEQPVPNAPAAGQPVPNAPVAGATGTGAAGPGAIAG